MERGSARAGVVAGVLLATALTACSGGPTTVGPPETTAPASEPAVEGLPTWERLDGLSVARDDFGTAVIGEEIWVLGGMTGDRGNRLDSIEVLDTSNDTWRVYDGTLPEGLASFEAVAVGTDVYVFGGFDVDSTPTDFSAVLDTETGRWKQLPPLPTARYAHTVTLHDGAIYVIGGEGRGGAVEQVDVFDPVRRTWSTGAPMPDARAAHDAVAAGEVIYVLGGWSGDSPSDIVQTYDPATGTWETAPSLPEGMSRAGATFHDGRLWVSLHESSYVLDVSGGGGGGWQPANALTVSRHGLGYVAVGDRIYAIGGCTESPLRDVRTVDVLDVGEVEL